MRTPDFSDEQIIAAGEALERDYLLQAEVTGRRPRRVTGSAITAALGGGKASRATRLWLAHVAVRDGGTPEAPLRLPETLHAEVQGNLDAIYRLIAKAERDARVAASRSGEEYVKDLLADNDDLRAENDRLATTIAALEGRIAGLEQRAADLAVQAAAQDGEIARLTAEVDGQRRRADTAEAQVAAIDDTALEIRAVAMAADGARRAAEAALRRLGTEAEAVRGRLAGSGADGLGAEIEALLRLSAAALAAADANLGAEIPEVPKSGRPAAGGRHANGRREEAQPDARPWSGRPE